MTDKKLSQLPLGSAIGQLDLWYADQSAASVAQKSSTVRTFVRPESIDVMNPIYGVVTGTVSGAQRLTNLAGINSAIVDAIANGCEFVDFIGPIFQIDGTIIDFDATTPSGVTTRAPKLRGIRFYTRIEQWNSSGGIDTIHVGPPVGNASGQGSYGGGVINLWIVSMIDQSTITPLTGHLGAQLSITSCEQCEFSGLAIGEIAQRIVDTTHFAYNGIGLDPASGAFSCVYRDIEIKGYGNIGFNAVGSDSGSIHYNIMVRNGGLGEPALKVSTGPAWWIANSQGIWDQMNIEWSNFGGFNVTALLVTSGAGCQFGHIHMEGLELSCPSAGGSGGLIGSFGLGNLRINSLQVITLNLPTGCNISSAGIFTFGFNAGYQTTVLGQFLLIQTLTLGSGVNLYFVNTIGGASTISNCIVDFDGPCTMVGDGTFAPKLTNWSNCSFLTNGQGPANGLGVPPTNFRGRSILTITTSAYGYSGGVFTASMLDDNDLYQWNAGVNGTVVLPLTVMDALQPVTVPPYPGTEREIVNIDTHTCAVHDSAGTNLLTATNLTTGQFVRLRFMAGSWIQVNSGTRL